MEGLCRKELMKLTGKKHVVFTKRCNSSIDIALRFAKKKGYSDVFIQDQGGWMTYPKFIKENGLIQHDLKTDYGVIISFKEKKAVLLIHSMAAYAALLDMEKIAVDCKNNDSFLINDVCGSIGTKEAVFGDVIVGSFGRWKPLNLGTGGFIATDDDVAANFFKEFAQELDFVILHRKLCGLRKRFVFLEEKVVKIMSDLESEGYEILHIDKKGLNVIVKYSSEQEKEKLINYCKDECFEFVECPKYIRVLDKAISIEVKRFDN